MNTPNTISANSTLWLASALTGSCTFSSDRASRPPATGKTE